MSEKPKYCSSEEPGKHSGFGLITLSDGSLTCRAHLDLKDFVERELARVDERQLGEFSRNSYNDVLDEVERLHWTAAASAVAQMNLALGNEQRIHPKEKQNVVRMTRSVKKAPRRVHDEANIERVVGLGLALGAA